jgi:hypothetical protein
MPLQLFTETEHCTLRIHCATCRSKNGGRDWRRSLTQYLALPNNDLDFECPVGIPWESVDVPQMVVALKPSEWQTAQGPQMWAELHTKLDATPVWLAEFTARIPCGDCRAHFQTLLREMPPVFGTGWLTWTIAAHNHVNRRLLKPEMTEADARARWLT